MNQWDMILALTVIVPFIAVFAGISWRFGSMITELKTMIENLSRTIDRIENESKEESKLIMARIEDHDLRLRQVEKEIIRIGDKHNE